MSAIINKLYNIYLQYPNVCTDSRQIKADSLFFALKGSNFNGNEYAQQALDKGAAYAIIDEAPYQIDDRYILVDDVLQTLQDLARHHRRQFEIPIIAITGSNGKTTTKELVSAVMGTHYKTHFTKGNFNNHIGVPLTLLAMPMDSEVAIIEMGANHIGEINFLCQIAEPTHGLITNIGKAHLEGFGSLEGVKKAKSELYRYLAQNRGLVFLNMNEDYLVDLAAANKLKLFYTQSDTPHPTHIPHEVKLQTTTPYIKVAFLSEDQELVEAQSQLVGMYNFNNIMTAVVFGKYFKVPAHKIQDAIASYVPSNNRSQLVYKNSNTFMLDAYNANPSSMRGALNHLKTVEAEGKIAILGDMLELGIESLTEHQAILDLAQTSDLEQVILVGKIFNSLHTNCLQFPDVDTLKAWFAQQHFENKYFLIKGSRGIKLEKLLESTAYENLS